MPTTTYPGVYVEEDHSLSLNISSGSTCVPIFIFDPFVEKEVNYNQEAKSGKIDITIKELFNKVIAITSWMDYQAKFGALIKNLRSNHTASILLPINTITVIQNQINEAASGEKFVANESYSRQMNALGYFPLQHYFENGGGPCYVYLTTQTPKPTIVTNMRALLKSYYEPDAATLNFDTLKSTLADFVDITTVCLGASAEVNSKAYIAISEYLLEATGHSAPLFCVVGTESQDSLVSSYNVMHQTAAYYPYLRTSYTLSLNDLDPKNIKFEGYKNIIDRIGLSSDDLTIRDPTHFTLPEMLKETTGGAEFAQTMLKTLERKVILSPVYAVLGAYCRTDAQRGVWKAPANVALSSVIGLCNSAGVEVNLTDTLNTTLVKNGINPIRYFPDRGHIIWGSRTMVAETQTDWRYIPVRRLFNIAERDIKEAMARAVFEPNTPLTWEVIRSAIDSYLHNLWKQGALFGDSPEQAYSVTIGLGSTMTADDIKAGHLIVKVAMAAVRPAEFIILEFSQKQI